MNPTILATLVTRWVQDVMPECDVGSTQPNGSDAGARLATEASGISLGDEFYEYAVAAHANIFSFGTSLKLCRNGNYS